MSENECKCGKPTRDAAYVCDDCGDELARALGEVPWLSDELEVTLTGQRGTDYRGSGARGTETPSPVHWGASEASTHLKSILVSWALLCVADGVRSRGGDPGLPADTLPALSRWLMWRVDGLTLVEPGGEAVEEIVSAVAHCRRIVDRRPDKWYAGPCGEIMAEVECRADLYALSDKGDVKCPVCGSTFDVAARRTWLLAAAEDRLADAATLARSVSWLGALPLNAARVRKWAERGRIVAKGHDGDRPLYRIGDAIDLLAKEAA